MKQRCSNHFSFLFFVILAASIFGQEIRTNEELLQDAMKKVYTNPQKSIEIGEKFLSYKQNEPSLEFRYLMLLAQAYVMIPDYEKSLKYANGAYDVAQKNRLYPNQINASTFLGNHYLRLKLNEKAWQALEQSEKIIREHPLADSLDHIQGNVYLLKGYLYSDIDHKKAIDAFGKAAAIFKKTKNQELGSINLGVALTHKGRVQTIDKQLDSAIYTFNEVIRLSSPKEPNGLSAFAHLSLAEAYSQKSEFIKSNELLFQALKIARDSQQTELIKEIYKLLAENYFGLNDLENFSKYNALYKQSLGEFEESELKSIEKVAESSEASNYHPINWTTTIWTVCIFLIVLVIFLFSRSYFLKKKMN